MAQPVNPDLQLVQKAIHGNRKAFTALFNRYFQSVYNFALMLSRDPALAEDLTQEAFIRAHANLEKLGPPWNFRAWIFRLTRNYFIDLTRKDHDIDPLEEDIPVKSPGPGPEKETMSRETADRVQNTLNKLNIHQREILVLRELNEFSYAEIGEILNIRDSNVKVSLHRARAAFQESYGIQLLLEDPEGECGEVAGLLGSLHDNEGLLDQDRFVREHLKVCEECQQRRQLLIDQSMVFGAFIPVIPPKALAERILKKITSPKTGPTAQKSNLINGVMGFGGATAVLGVMVWIIFNLIFNTYKILPNFPRAELENTPAVLAPPAPTDSADQPPPPQPPPPPPPPPPQPLSLPATSSDSELSVRCNLFDGLEISLILLNLPAETRNLPLYLKIEGGVPGLDPDVMNGEELYEYSAKLGDIQAYQCGLQGFPDRLYCMFHMPPGTEGTGLDFELRLKNCEDPVYLLPKVAIPEPKSEDGICQIDMNEENCLKAGGAYYKITDKQTICVCP